MDTHKFTWNGRQYAVGPEEAKSAYGAEILRLVEDAKQRQEGHIALLEERDGLKLAAEEAQEINGEASRALAALAGESLIPCGDQPGPCPGHLGPKTLEAYRAALAAWQALQEGNRQAVERIGELEKLLENVREQVRRETERDHAPERHLLSILLTEINQNHQEGEGALDTLRRIVRERDGYLKGRESALSEARKAGAALEAALSGRDSWRSFAQKMRLERDAAQRENRLKCLELGEQAGAIRELKEELALAEKKMRGAEAVAAIARSRAEQAERRADDMLDAEAGISAAIAEAQQQRATKLLALLDSEEPPVEAMGEVVPTSGFSSARNIWRWLRQQVADHVPPVAPEG